MSYSQSDVDALKKAMASGLLSYEHNGTRAVYRSLAEMQRQLDVMIAEVTPANAIPTRTVGVVSSGLQRNTTATSWKRNCR